MAMGGQMAHPDKQHKTQKNLNEKIYAGYQHIR
jgi:hypothetical protein